jgi:hypothetical protein
VIIYLQLAMRQGMSVEAGHINKSLDFFWRWQVRALSYNSNKLTNQMQHFHKFITRRLCVAQRVLGASTPIIRRLQLH